MADSGPCPVAREVAYNGLDGRAILNRQHEWRVILDQARNPASAYCIWCLTSVGPNSTSDQWARIQGDSARLRTT